MVILMNDKLKNTQPVGQGAQAAHAIGKRPVSKKLLAIVICCVVLAAAIIGAVIFATASTPEKTVEKYMNAIVDNDMAAAYPPHQSQALHRNRSRFFAAYCEYGT